MRDLWERVTGESAKAYVHFALYRDMGSERSLRKVAEGGEGTAKIRQLEKWSVRWRWVERAQAYDDEMDRQLRAKKEKARKEMAERHAKMALIGQGTVLERFRQIKPEELTPSQAVQWFDTLTKIERLALGEPTEIQRSEHAGTLDIEARYRAMTPEERRAEFVRIFRDELGRTQEEAEALAHQAVGAKADVPLSER
jgi:hypothetical protein